MFTSNKDASSPHQPKVLRLFFSVLLLKINSCHELERKSQQLMDYYYSVLKVKDSACALLHFHLTDLRVNREEMSIFF